MSLTQLINQFLGEAQKKASVGAEASNTTQQGDTAMNAIIHKDTQINANERKSTQRNAHADDLLPTINGALTNGYSKTRAQRWLDSRITYAATNGVTMEKCCVTPEVAALLLERNASNRKLNEGDIQRYADDIMAARWAFNGETLIVSDDGFLNDGQHRCHAVIRAGRAIETAVVFGVPRESRTTVDGGRVRQVGDYLQMDDIPNGTNVAAAARKIMEIEDYGKIITSADLRHSKQAILDRSRQDSEILASVRACHLQGYGKVGSLSMLATAHYFLKQVDVDAADQFIHKLVSGADLPLHHPIWTARNKLVGRDVRLNQNEKLKTIIMGWNNWRAGKQKVRTVTHTVKKGEALPEIRK